MNMHMETLLLSGTAHEFAMLLAESLSEGMEDASGNHTAEIEAEVADL